MELWLILVLLVLLDTAAQILHTQWLAIAQVKGTAKATGKALLS
jgi:hypothetical protein